MKHLAEYSKNDFVRKDDQYFYFTASAVAQAFSSALALGVTDLILSGPELEAFCMAYDQILPWDWDGARFRGVRLHLETSHAD